MLLFYQRSGTWIDDDKADLNSLFHIPNYSFIHEKRKANHKGGGLGIDVHKTLDYKILPNLTKNTENIETFTTEIVNKKQCIGHLVETKVNI